MSLHIQAKDGEIEELALHVDELESKCMELENLVKLLEDRNLNSEELFNETQVHLQRNLSTIGKNKHAFKKYDQLDLNKCTGCFWGSTRSIIIMLLCSSTNLQFFVKSNSKLIFCSINIQNFVKPEFKKG